MKTLKIKHVFSFEEWKARINKSLRSNPLIFSDISSGVPELVKENGELNDLTEFIEWLYFSTEADEVLPYTYVVEYKTGLCFLVNGSDCLLVALDDSFQIEEEIFIEEEILIDELKNK